MCVCVCVCVYVHMCACMHVCVCVCACVRCQLSSDLAMDEAALTGESDAVNKSSEKPIILSGSSVVEGEAVCLVFAVGVKSMRGSIAASLEQEVEVRCPNCRVCS